MKNVILVLALGLAGSGVNECEEGDDEEYISPCPFDCVVTSYCEANIDAGWIVRDSYPCDDGYVCCDMREYDPPPKPDEEPEYTCKYPHGCVYTNWGTPQCEPWEWTCAGETCMPSEGFTSRCCGSGPDCQSN